MTASKSAVFNFGDVEVREREFTLARGGEVLPCEPKAFRVLLYLLRNPHKLVRKEELLDAVWGDAAVTENSLTRAIAQLRRLLGDDAREPRYIETVATVGYRLVCNVEVAEEQTAATAEPPAVPLVAPVEEKKAGSHKRIWVLALAGGAVLAAGMAGTVWYLRRPLPPPRITAYTRITHDGRNKDLAGTDGSRLYFTQSSPSQFAQVAVNGGEIAPLPIAVPGVYAFLADISPDGSKVLVASFEQGHSEDSIWIAPLLGGAARRLEEGFSPAFSSDGGSMIYSTLDGEIFLEQLDGTGKRKLASAGGRAFGFEWSPDRRHIRFTKLNDGLWEMASDGSGLHRLLPGWKGSFPPCCGAWAQDGSLYLFLADGQLWALDERHSLLRQSTPAPIQLTSGPTRWDAPVPGRDGRTIYIAGATLRGELSRIDPKTGSPQPFLGGISAEFVSFSPDGKFVAYVTFPEGILWRADRDGGNRIQLSQPPDYAVNPRWSPDSQEIVYATRSPTGHDSIHRISAADGRPLWLLPEERGDMHDACWSPDGKKVLFAASAGAGFTKGKRDLRIVDLATHQVTVLAGSEGRWSPRWSPDGRYILAMHGTESDLQLFDFTTRKWRRLPLLGDGEFPSFSRDSRFVYYLRFPRDQGIFRIPVADGAEERVAAITDWHLTGFMTYSMSLDPTDAPLVLRDTGSDDIYGLTLEVK